jgi:hypothetical protein
MDAVLTKKQNYRLWQGGAFGNKLRAWRSLREWRFSDYRGPVALRSLGAAGGGHCIYDVNPGQVTLAIEEMHRRGVPDGAIMVNEMAPSNAYILQGEYLNAVREDGLWGHFFHSQVSEPMRIALLSWRARTTHGLMSDLLIREAMTPASYEDWRELLDRYPDHVLEVSIFDRCLGDLPHRNALVWEVRRY